MRNIMIALLGCLSLSGCYDRDYYNEYPGDHFGNHGYYRSGYDNRSYYRDNDYRYHNADRDRDWDDRYRH